MSSQGSNDTEKLQPPASAKRLFTPGPLSTSRSVKEAMLCDLGSRDEEFIELVADIRSKILSIAGTCTAEGYEAIPMQGSGTFGIESVLATMIAPHNRLLILINGVYGNRIAKIADCHKIGYETVCCEENQIHSFTEVESKLKEGKFSHLVVVHCETTSGILNPIDKWSELAARYDCRFIVDAMSSFGGIPINVIQTKIDVLVSSSNKCLQGVPGFAFVIARRELISDLSHEARSVSLDLREQLNGLDSNGQFRFTPPTHAILAFHQALAELDREGGVQARFNRYQKNQRMLIAGMRLAGFKEYVPEELQSPVITSFLYPNREGFDFKRLYLSLSSDRLVIYPGKLTKVDSFRIGTIGHLFENDILELLAAIKRAC